MIRGDRILCPARSFVFSASDDKLSRWRLLVTSTKINLSCEWVGGCRPCSALRAQTASLTAELTRSESSSRNRVCYTQARSTKDAISLSFAPQPRIHARNSLSESGVGTTLSGPRSKVLASCRVRAGGRQQTCMASCSWNLLARHANVMDGCFE